MQKPVATATRIDVLLIHTLLYTANNIICYRQSLHSSILCYSCHPPLRSLVISSKAAFPLAVKIGAMTDTVARERKLGLGGIIKDGAR